MLPEQGRARRDTVHSGGRFVGMVLVVFLVGVSVAATYAPVYAAGTAPTVRLGLLDRLRFQSGGGQAPEDATAAGLLLTAADFPADWQAMPHSQQPTPLEQCAIDVPGRTGVARGATFSPDGGIKGVAETVSLFDTPADAAASTSLLPGVLDCVTGVLLSPAPAGMHITDVSYEPEASPALGDGIVAYRLQFGMTNDQSGVSSEDADDLIYVTLGRVGFSLQAGNLGAPFPSDVLQALATQAAAIIENAVLP